MRRQYYGPRYEIAPVQLTRVRWESYVDLSPARDRERLFPAVRPPSTAETREMAALLDHPEHKPFWLLGKEAKETSEAVQLTRLDFALPSAHRPLSPDFAEQYAETPENHTIRGRIYSAAGTRPKRAVIAIHGFTAPSLDSVARFRGAAVTARDLRRRSQRRTRSPSEPPPTVLPAPTRSMPDDRVWGASHSSLLSRRWRESRGERVSPESTRGARRSRTMWKLWKYYTKVEVAEHERVLLFRRDNFERVLDAGHLPVLGPARPSCTWTPTTSRTRCSSTRSDDFLLKTHDGAEPLTCDVVELGDHEVGLVFIDQQAATT